MKWVVRHKTNKGFYVSMDMQTWTPFLGQAARFDSESDALGRTMHITGPLEASSEEWAVRDQIRDFIKSYERDPERTNGEKAAVAAMSTLAFHGGSDLGVLENSTLRATQVLQAFQGLIARLGHRHETDTERTAELEVQARNESVPVPLQRGENSG